MSVSVWVAIIIIFIVVFFVSDWLCDKLFALIKKSIAKRREKKFVKYVKPLSDESLLSVDELFKED